MTLLVARIPDNPRHEAGGGNDAYDADHVHRRAGDVVYHSLLLLLFALLSLLLDSGGGGGVVAPGGGAIEVSVEGADNLRWKEDSKVSILQGID